MSLTDLLIQQPCEDEAFLQLIQPEYSDEQQLSTNDDGLTKSELMELSVDVE